MLISTFELLVKPQLPTLTSPPLPSPPPTDLATTSRTVIQGYFLTISNTINANVALSLVFTSLTPGVNAADTVVLLDATGTNLVSDVTPLPLNRSRFSFSLNALDTALFILQPDIISNPGLLRSANLEIRGYSEIFISSLSTASAATLLITPEHRGTFFKNLDAADPQLDQIAYSLPTANGGSLFRLRRSDGGGDGM
jgi:hypothetical protein